jgi:(p)ppGpp synthase/HD superfamily hydrolase
MYGLYGGSGMNLIHEAIIFATRKHAGQVRKGTDIPYISHPMEVMQILTENDLPENVIVAGILHDTLEDTDTAPAEILERFGEDILKIVSAESEDKSKPWKERKQATIDHLAAASLDARLVCCADKLSNLRSMAADLEAVGERLWERFNAAKPDIEWYYRGIAKALWLPRMPMIDELNILLEKVFK